MQLDKKGNTILMALAVVALVAVLFPILATRMNHSSKIQSERRVQEDFQSFIDSLRLDINDGVACANILRAVPQNINPSLLSNGSVKSNFEQAIRLNMTYAGVAGPIGAGWFNANAGYTVEKVSLVLKRRSLDQTGAPRQVTLDWPPFVGILDKFEAELVLTPRGINWNSDLPEKRIPIYVNLKVLGAASSRIEQCFGPGSMAEACEAVGGGFDGVNSPVNLRCNPDIRCFNSHQGIVTNSGSCVYPYVANSLGITGGTQNYLCTWCNRNK